MLTVEGQVGAKRPPARTGHIGKSRAYRGRSLATMMGSLHEETRLLANDWIGRRRRAGVDAAAPPGLVGVIRRLSGERRRGPAAGREPRPVHPGDLPLRRAPPLGGPPPPPPGRRARPR